MVAEIEEKLTEKFKVLNPEFNERLRRLWAAAEAKALGHGGVTLVSRVTGLSRTTIHQGLKDLANPAASRSQGMRRQRAVGGGRKPLTEHYPELLKDVEALVEPMTRGDPESALRWTCKSTRQLAESLQGQGYKIGRQKVAEVLAELGYSLQSPRKSRAGSSHPDRDAQFNYINDHVAEFQNYQQPVISVDTKKKELVGDFHNGGREWQPKGRPEQVRCHDFVDKKLGKVTPYGVYDPSANVGWVSVGTDHDTAEFAVESIRRWWQTMGQERYPNATRLLITADCGGSNGYRLRLWKVALQQFAHETGLTVFVCHFPPGTSKWNKIEHRMFSYISMNWRGKPLISHEVIVNLIGATSTRQGLAITAALDTNSYPKGKKVSDKALQAVNLSRASFHGEWNYSIAPDCPT